VGDRMMNEVERLIILTYERMLLVFDSAVITAFKSAFPSATVTGGYFYLTQSVMRKVNDIGMKRTTTRMTVQD